MRDSTRQSRIGWGLVLGVIFIVCGIGGMWVSGVAGVYRGTYTRALRAPTKSPMPAQ